MEKEEEARLRMAHEDVLQDAGVLMNADSLLEKVVASTISGIIVSVIVIVVLNRVLNPEEATEAAVDAVDAPTTPTW